MRRILLGPEITNFRRAARGAQRLAAAEGAHASVQAHSFRDAREDALRLLIVASLIAGVLVVILLVTANDLARAAERALAQTGSPGRAS